MEMKGLSKRKWLFAFAAVLAIGVVLRIPGLADPFWIDEVISVETAALDLASLFQRVGFADLHPPLYYLLLSFWTWVFGNSEISARMLSLLVAAGTLVLVYRWAHSRYGHWQAVAATLLLALSTFHIHYSVEVRSYGLLAFLAIATLYMADRVTTGESPRRLHWASLVALESALLLTHYYAVVPVLAANLYFFTFRPAQRSRVFAWVLSQGMCLALLGLWLPLILVQYFHLPSAMFAHLGRSDVARMTLLALGPAPVHPSQIVAWFSSGLLLTAAAGGVLLDLKRSKAAPTRTPDHSRFFLSVGESRTVVLLLCLLLAAPMFTVAFIEGSEATLPLLLQELPLAYALLFLAVILLMLAAVANRKWLRRGHAMAAPPFFFATTALLLLALGAAQARFLPRNVIFFLPLAAISATSLLKAKGLLARAALIALIVGICLPSVIRQRSFEPRQDFRGAAHFINNARLHPKAELSTFVLPMWDRPGLEFYLGKGSASGLMNTGQLPLQLSLPEKIAIVLTREAFERRTEFLAAISRALEPKYGLEQTSSFSRVLVVIFSEHPPRR